MEPPEIGGNTMRDMTFAERISAAAIVWVLVAIAAGCLVVDCKVQPETREAKPYYEGTWQDEQ
ncbi:hypothetical protein OAF54_02985 [bacterium]|nr:hypothetical protein [bacterium]